MTPPDQALLRPGAGPRRRRSRASLVSLAVAAMVAGSLVTASAPGVARAESVSTLQQRASALAAAIQTNYDRLGILDEAYNQAHQRLAHLDAAIETADRRIVRARRALSADRRHLRQVAIEAYVSGGTLPNLSMLLSNRSNQAPMQQTYIQAASGDLSQAAVDVVNARHALSLRQSALERDRRQAEKTSRSISASRSRAKQIVATLESQLAAVKGRLAQAVAVAERQRQLQRAAAARAAALARQQAALAQQQAQQQQQPPPPVTGGGSGAVAVRAAESQLGVPYVWGGATPGVGFDCSGLTMWAWSQAGVSLAHGATPQYYEIAHVSMSSLQPGDLIFYGTGSYLYHVVMYVGSGPYGSDTVIQAEQTGTNVMYTPIPPGAYGAGRP